MDKVRVQDFISQLEQITIPVNKLIDPQTKTIHRVPVMRIKLH